MCNSASFVSTRNQSWKGILGAAFVTTLLQEFDILSIDIGGSLGVIVNLMVNYHQRLDSTFQALADPTRRAILTALARGEVAVSVLAAPHEMSLPAVMKHLQVLERAGLITHKKKGRVRHCRLSAEPLKQTEAWLSQLKRKKSKH